VGENGGKPQLVLNLDSAKYERSFLWPQFLPDGQHFVFFVRTDLADTTGVYAGTLDPPEYHRLFNSETECRLLRRGGRRFVEPRLPAVHSASAI